ncbi:unnamed protein product [Owenia fusiformis]|uniref:Uncharacterized protein n=1 Tax=Owenia fusiformis TaxID=6347 RepID=A0A8J1TXI5_OWEFU|nr:unnamed protein product [Owenia fusiformis]
MPPKFKRHLESGDYNRARNSEKSSLLDAGSEDEEDFFLTGPNARPRELGDSKIARVQGQVHDVIDVMKDNIGKVMDRGERLEDLQDKSDDLSSNANMFRSRATDLRRNMWWKECKMRILLAVVVVVILLIIIIPIIIHSQKKDP